MTNLTSNIDDIILKFKGLAAGPEQVDFASALIVGVNAARGLMTFRIFNKGQKADGTPIGIYKGKKKGGLSNKVSNALFPDPTKKKRFTGGSLEFTPYELKRLKRGRQVAYKDLEFEGDLRRGIKTIKESNVRVVCAIPNEALAAIANGQEEQIGTAQAPAIIFGLSAKEAQALRENTSAALKQIYVKLLNA